jgi:hypothetical protein
MGCSQLRSWILIILMNHVLFILWSSVLWHCRQVGWYKEYVACVFKNIYYFLSETAFTLWFILLISLIFLLWHLIWILYVLKYKILKIATHHTHSATTVCILRQNTDRDPFSQSNDRQSVSLSWCLAPSGAHDQILITVWHLLFCRCWASPLMRGRVCHLS